MAETILVLEDDLAMQSFLATLLKTHQHPVVSFSEGLAAMQHLVSQHVDLVLLDLGLTDLDGQSWLQQIRQWTEVPVIVISARHGEQDKVMALDNGANDYMTKPFSANELMARVRANLRKIQHQPQVFSFGEVQLDPVLHRVTKAGEEVHLTKTEFQLLLLLMRYADKVLTHNFVLSQVWGKAYVDRPEYVRVHMAQLRQKLEDNPAAPTFLKTEPGVGYRLKV